MARRKRKVTIVRESARKPEGIADLLGKLEVEAERFVKKVIEKTEESSREIKRGIQDVVDRIRLHGIYSVAAETKEDLEAELRQRVEDVLDRVREIELLPRGKINSDRILRDAKKNLDEVVAAVRSSEIFALAKVKAENTRNQVLTLLSIPTEGEVNRLQTKITSLEKRINKLTRAAA